VATAGFLQVLLDSTVEEALVKFGFRYATQEDWGRLRRLFRVGLAVKLGGGLLAGMALLAIAPAAEAIFGIEGLLVPLLVAAALPVAQGPESVAGAALIVRGRYDVRAAFMAVSMGLRLAGVAVGSLFGVTEIVAGMVAGQLVATAAIAVAGRVAFARFPAAPPRRLDDDRAPIRRFVAWAAAGSGLASGRTTLAAVLVGVATTAVEVGYFRAAQASQTAFGALSAPARLVLLAEQTRDHEAGDHRRVYRLLGRYVVATSALAAVLVPVLWWLMEDVLRFLYGAGFAPATDAARLILVAAALLLVWGWTKLFPVSIGRPGLRVAGHAVELAVLAPLLLPLASRWGAEGAAGALLASTVAYVLFWSLLLFRLRRERLGAPAKALAH
jgi:PST family polysaccharide transporter